MRARVIVAFGVAGLLIAVLLVLLSRGKTEASQREEDSRSKSQVGRAGRDDPSREQASPHVASEAGLRETPEEPAPTSRPSRPGLLTVRLLADEGLRAEMIRVTVASSTSGSEPVEWRSDGNGAASGQLPVGHYEVWISEPGYEQRARRVWVGEWEDDDSKTEVELELFAAVELVIEVVDDGGRPLTEAQVEVQTLDDGNPSEELFEPGWVVAKRANVFRAFVPTGAYLVRGAAPGATAASEVVDAQEPGVHRVRLSLGRAGSARLPEQSPRAERECVVTGDAADVTVTVAPARGERFAVTIHRAPAVVRVPGLGEPTRLEVRGALHFRAVAAEVPFFLREPVVSTDGMVRLAAGSQVFPRLDPNGEVTATLDLGGASLSPVKIACAALALERGWPDAETDFVDSASYWIPREGTRFRFRSAPSASASAVTLTGLPGSEAPFARGLRAEAGWILLAYEASGVTIQGWVLSSEVREVEAEELMNVGGRGSSVMSTTCGRGVGFGDARYYSGPARIAAGTVVGTQDEGGEWAIVAADETFGVTHFEGSEWVEVDHIPGLELGCSGTAEAVVPRSAVTLPDVGTYPASAR